ncbi:MAG: hypothetical protein Q4A27_02810 [bacterium]|nr:hypothetical protein [bacterium]
MRDIDFEELDRAVNRFLGKTEEPENTSEKAEAPVVVKEESPKAEDLATQKTEDLADEPEKITVKIKKKNNDLKDNFSEKPQRARKQKRADILDNFESTVFEAPILDDFSSEIINEDLEKGFVKEQDFEKIMPEITSKNEPKTVDNFVFEKQPAVEKSNQNNQIDFAKIENVPISAPILEAIPVPSEPISAPKIIESAPKIEPNLDFAAPKPEPMPIRETAARVVVPNRTGVFRIDDEENLRVFGKDSNATLNRANSIDVPQISKTPVNNFENSKADFETAPLSKTEEPAKIIAKEAPADKISDEEKGEVQTPFVVNPKIEKRPLGSAPQNFEPIKNEEKAKFQSRNQAIRRAKHENIQPSTPILSREEYSAPIQPKKKKSGWGAVFLIMLILAICGAGAGLAAMYLLR